MSEDTEFRLPEALRDADPEDVEFRLPEVLKEVEGQ